MVGDFVYHNFESKSGIILRIMPIKVYEQPAYIVLTEDQKKVIWRELLLLRYDPNSGEVKSDGEDYAWRP